MKKDSELFDMTMDVFDGAEVCKLVSNFLLHKLSEKYGGKNLALYRGVGLANFKNVSGPTSEKNLKKNVNCLENMPLNLEFSTKEKS